MKTPVDVPEGKTKAFDRLLTGIPGLDTLLTGGLLGGGVYLLIGLPGSGKTILANQIAFNHVRRGGRALYVTLLAETHARMFGNLQEFGFFDEDHISDSINYLAAYSVLEESGLNGLMKTLGEAVRKYKASFIFIDGIVTAETLADSPVSFKKFVHQLSSILSTSGCTTFLLSSMDGPSIRPEHTMVDGIIRLSTESDGRRNHREIEVCKFRGSAHLEGRHTFKITQGGIEVWPRVESYLGHDGYAVPAPSGRKKFGVKTLDRMLSGGVMGGSITSLLGPAGSGKTTLGFHFLNEGAERGETCLYLGLYEVPERMIMKLDGVGLPIRKHIEEKRIGLIWQPQLELSSDELITTLLNVIRERKVSRLFVDGVTGIREGMFDPTRINVLMGALSIELRRLGVTTLFVEETRLWPSKVKSPVSDFSAVTDNIFFMRHAEIDSSLQLMFSVVKSRESARDPQVMWAEITAKGYDLVGPLKNASSGLVTGSPRQKKTSRSRKSR